MAPDGEDRVDVAVRGGKIVAIGKFDAASAGEVCDAAGLHILPGVIEMPNTNPSTTAPEMMTDKLARARGRMPCLA